MSFQVTEAFVQNYRDGITIRAQQMDSRLRGRVTVDSGLRGTSASRDFIGSRTPTKQVSRHADTILSDTPHDRRWVDIARYHDADLIDDHDKVRMLSDPTNPYSRAIAMGMGRKIDAITIAGAQGVTRIGADGGSTSAAPTTTTVHGSANMTIAKMRSTKRLFDVAEMGEMRHWAITANQVDAMLNIDDMQTIDVNTVRVLAQGGINSFMGFEWVRVEDPILIESAANVRDTVVWVPDAVWLAFGEDIRGSIDRRPDKNNSVQVFYSMDLGAARLEDAGVIVVECLETAGL